MEWGKLVYLLVIVFIGYLPYKTILRLRKDGLASISTSFSLLMAVWFLVLSTLLIFQTPNLYINASPIPIVVLGITVLMWVTAPWLLRRIGRYPAEVIGDKPKWYILRAEPKTFILKLSEVLFQQAKFTYLLLVVLGAMPPVSRIWWFTGIISILHLANIFFVPAGWFFFLVSIPMGPLFSWLILNGYVTITLAIHFWFYLLVVIWFWFRR